MLIEGLERTEEFDPWTIMVVYPKAFDFSKVKLNKSDTYRLVLEPKSDWSRKNRKVEIRW